MKKTIYLAVLLFLSIVTLSGCTNKITLRKATWQGTYYPNGCLTCEKEYVYSPIYNNYNDCKTWALNKKSNPDDKMTCSKNCKTPDKYGMQTCEEVVRNWVVTPDSVTFDNYKE